MQRSIPTTPTPRRLSPLAVSVSLFTLASACTMETRSPETLPDPVIAAGAASGQAADAGPPRLPAADSGSGEPLATGASLRAADAGAPSAPMAQGSSGASAAGSGGWSPRSATTAAAISGSSAGAMAGSGGGGMGASSQAAASQSGGAGASAAGTSAGNSAQSQAGERALPASQLDKCSTDLAQCIIDSPLNYDGCLRKNAERGCPALDAGTPSSSVLDEDGNPISQVCQAELAKCIMNNPTPENALACTEHAMKCK